MSPCHFLRPSNSQRWLRQNQEGISHKGTLNLSLLGTLLLKHLPLFFPPILQDGCWEIPRAEVLERGSGTEPTLQVPLLGEDVPAANVLRVMTKDDQRVRVGCARLRTVCRWPTFPMRQNLAESKDLVYPTQVFLKHVWYQSVLNKNEWLILNPRFSLCVSS